MTSATQQEYRRAYGREWRQMLMTDAQTVALAGCGAKTCLAGAEGKPQLCRICQATVTRLVLALVG